mgnify:CR=1 FL=1
MRAQAAQAKKISVDLKIQHLYGINSEVKIAIAVFNKT